MTRDPKQTRFWRVLGTGIAFVTFMLAATVLTLIAFPLLHLFTGPGEKKRLGVRRLIQVSFDGFLKFCTMLGVLRTPSVVGLESRPQSGPCIFIANHPTLLDIVVLGSVLGDCNYVVKNVLWKHLFLGGAVRAAEYIPNRNGLQFVRACEEGLRQGKSLIIFPEGTRSTENGLHPFNRGAAYLALRTGVPVVPVVITCSPKTLMKHHKWYEVPDRAPKLNIRFHPPIVLKEDFLKAKRTTERVQVLNLTHSFEQFFQEKLERYTDRPNDSGRILVPRVKIRHASGVGVG